jgi:signal transduction histidine kinase
MVYDILDFSKDRVKLNIIEIDPRLYLSEIQKFIFTIMKKKNIDVNYHIDDINTIHIDPEKFRRVIYNLAGNAMDAMEDGGSFSIKLKKRGRFIVFSFSDTGSGVPDEAINKLFEPFFTQGKTHGTGLGLAIVKKIVEEQGGKIEVSTKSGEGTSFHIFLPDSQGEK